MTLLDGGLVGKRGEVIVVHETDVEICQLKKPLREREETSHGSERTVESNLSAICCRYRWVRALGWQ